jgi:hypothetical protein
MAERLAASQEGFSSMELVRHLVEEFGVLQVYALIGYYLPPIVSVSLCVDLTLQWNV